MDMENKIYDICEMQKSVISCLKEQMDAGVCNVDTKEAGEVVDIIKDLAQAEKYIREAKYYELVASAMEEKDGTSDRRYGYTPRVRGNIRMGYKDMIDQEPYINGYLYDPNFEDKMRSKGSEYGEPYNDYMTARRHYTETKSPNDKAMMDIHAREHIEQTIETIEDIWDDASPELKGKMKSELKTLIDSMV